MSKSHSALHASQPSLYFAASLFYVVVLCSAQPETRAVPHYRKPRLTRRMTAVEINGVCVYNLSRQSGVSPRWPKHGESMAGPSSGGGSSAAQSADRSLELLQGLEFSTASTRVKASRDGDYLLVSGVHPPAVKVCGIRSACPWTLKGPCGRKIDARAPPSLSMPSGKGWWRIISKSWKCLLRCLPRVSGRSNRQTLLSDMMGGCYVPRTGL